MKEEPAPARSFLTSSARFPLATPTKPLRERRSDLLELADYFLKSIPSKPASASPHLHARDQHAHGLPLARTVMIGVD